MRNHLGTLVRSVGPHRSTTKGHLIQLLRLQQLQASTAHVLKHILAPKLFTKTKL